ncbi:MAG: response regulator, partial [Gemmatimonadales bacterium]|nr:response regulator [Gemmatimonadales bacterium]
AATREGPAVPRGSETVLVVEDEPQVLRVASRTLTELGYRVLEAQNGLEALRIADERGEEIDLLLTDLVMPQMGGKDLAIRLIGRHLRLKVLYVSGYTGQAVVRHDHLDASATFLAKPYVPATLARKVREVLDSPREV